MFEGSWQKDCASGAARKGLVGREHVRALCEGKGAGAERAQGVRKCSELRLLLCCAHICIMPVSTSWRTEERPWNLDKRSALPLSP
jgi:hypothetical protein